jgi:ABC-type multidrug transport system fused ATPase/permease subunit
MGIERYLSLEMALFCLFFGPILKGICDGQTYSRGRHIGLQVKGAIIAAVFHKATLTNLSATKEDVGSVNNLISVDVSAVQEFCCYSHLAWTSFLETAICISFLVGILGSAALVGVAVLLVTCPLVYVIGSFLMKYQDEMLSHKDKRMAVVSEVLNGIRIIKMFAWEHNFLEKIFACRSEELNSLRKYTIVQGLQSVMWQIVPILIAITSFLVYTHVQHKTLTPAIGFTALTLFDRLKLPVTWIPEMINDMISAHTSLKRIHSFLQAPEVLGISGHCVSQSRQQKSAIQKYDGRRLFSQPGCVDVVNAVFSWPTAKEKQDKPQDNKDKMRDMRRHNCDFPIDCDVRCCIGALCGIVSFCRMSYLKCIRFHRSKSNKDGNNKFSVFPILQPYQKLDDSSRHGGSSENQAVGVRMKNPVHAKEDSSEVTISFHSAVESEADDVDVEDIDNTAMQDEEIDDHSEEQTIKVVLKQVNLKVSQGELVVIVGMTGTGKSTLLSGILGESLLESGGVGIGISPGSDRTNFSGISYAAQSAWIQNATLRDNILFGLPFDLERYREVVFACCLNADFELMPGGDHCEIGEKGINLSGGQQQRVNIARAAYAKSSIIILDDVLSAVDPHVAEHILKHLILGFLAKPSEKRTCILVSNQISLTLPVADRIVVLGLDGQQCCTVVANTSVDNLAQTLESYISSIDLNSEPVNFELEKGYPGTTGAEFFSLLIDISKSVSSANANTSFSAVAPASESLISTVSETDLEIVPFTPTKTTKHSSTSTINHSVMKQSFSTNDFTFTSTELSKSEEVQENQSQGNLLVKDETMAKGEVKWEVFSFYLNALGGFYTGVLFVILNVLLSILRFVQNYYLACWMNDMVRSSSWNSGGQAMLDYLAFCCLVTIVTVLNVTCSTIFTLKGGKVGFKYFSTFFNLLF